MLSNKIALLNAWATGQLAGEGTTEPPPPPHRLPRDLPIAAAAVAL